MIIEKIAEMGENLALLEGHDRLHYLIDKAKDIEPATLFLTSTVLLEKEN